MGEPDTQLSGSFYFEVQNLYKESKGPLRSIFSTHLKRCVLASDIYRCAMSHTKHNFLKYKFDQPPSRESKQLVRPQ